MDLNFSFNTRVTQTENNINNFNSLKESETSIEEVSLSFLNQDHNLLKEKIDDLTTKGVTKSIKKNQNEQVKLINEYSKEFLHSISDFSETQREEVEVFQILSKPFRSEENIQEAAELQFHPLFQELKERTKKEPHLSYDKSSCRYRHILCPRHTNVALSNQTKTRYLHANKVQIGSYAFIAAQYPLLNLIEDFWKVVATCSFIIDLTHRKEGMENSYPPQIGQFKRYSDFRVYYEGQEQMNLNVALYIYQMKGINLVEEKTEVPDTSIQRLHYSDWKDGEKISLDDLEDLVKTVIRLQNDSKKPLFIHCLAGMGRTGTLIVAIELFCMISDGKINSDNFKEMLFKVILEGRIMRGEGFVNKPVQLQILYEFGLKLLEERLSHEKKA